MSDLTPPVDAGIPTDTPSVAAPEVPSAPSVEVPGGEPAAPQPSYLDLEQYGNYLVKVKVRGEERELPLSEVRNGLMMQADYTQSKQELAEERRRLAQAHALVEALDANPQATIRQLSEVYDLDVERGLSPVERTPEEQQLRSQQQALAQQEEALQRQRIQNEIAAITASDPTADLQALAEYVHRGEATTLTQAHRLMKADSFMAQQQKAAADAAAREAAARAQVVHDGTATQRGTVVPGGAAPAASIRDAWAQAKQQTHR